MKGAKDDPEVARLETDPLIAEKEVKLESFADDCWDTIKLGIPILFAMLSWVGVSNATRPLRLVASRHRRIH